jgi:putative membrane protein
MQRRREPVVLLLACLTLLVLSGLHPRDRLTWLLEVAPILLALPVLVATASRFPLTPLLYRLLFVHALILMVGGHYTYAEVPLGFWFRDALHLARNHYDRLGHLAQGFVPAILAREVLIRRSPLARSRWLPVLTVAVCLAFSALYELIEWWTALVNQQAAEAFLGTQGDQWDTQWDMFLCLVGAVLSLLLLTRTHDRALAALAGPPGRVATHAAPPGHG